MAKVENFPLSALSEDEERIENIQKRLIQFLYLGIRSCQDDDIIKLCMNRAMRTEVIHKWKKYESKSPLLECSKLGLHRLVKLFHQHCHMDPTKFGLSADNPLHHAAKGGHLEVVKYLIEKANCNPNSIIPYTGACPLHCAARRGQLPVVNYLIHEANVDCSLTDIVTYYFILHQSVAELTFS